MIPLKKHPVLVIFVLLSLFAGCVQSPSEGEEAERKIRIIYTDWTEAVAITQLCKVILEDRLDYKVVLKLTDVESAYEELAKDSADVFTDAWLPHTQSRYLERYGENIEQIGITYPEARIGLVVPAYSHLKTIADINKYPYSIIGIDAGAGIMHKTQLALKHYGLPNKLEESTDRRMTEQLIDSLVRKKDIVITGWRPHWIFARYQVRFLEDPDRIYGLSDNICTLASKHFIQEYSPAVRFFERLQLTERQLNTLIYNIRLEQDPVVGVKKWIDKNEFVVNQWIKDLRKERKKIM